MTRLRFQTNGSRRAVHDGVAGKVVEWRERRCRERPAAKMLDAAGGSRGGKYRIVGSRVEVRMRTDWVRKC